MLMESVRFNELELGRVRSYFEEWLLKGWTLGRLFLESTDLSNGHVLTTLPSVVGVEAASTGLSFGGKIPRGPWPVWGVLTHPDGQRTPTSEPEQGVLTFVTDWLSSRRDGLLVLCSEIVPSAGPPGDRGRATSRSLERVRVGTFGRETYHLLTSQDFTDLDRVIHAVGNVTSASGKMLAFLATSSEPPPVGVVTELDRGFLDAIALDTEAALVGAYDGEGHLVWTRTQLERWRGVGY
jgi:hypothetical protein